MQLQLAKMVSLDTQTVNHVSVAEIPTQPAIRKVANVIAQRILMDLNVTLALMVTLDTRSAIHAHVAVIPFQLQAVTRKVVNVIAM